MSDCEKKNAELSELVKFIAFALQNISSYCLHSHSTKN